MVPFQPAVLKGRRPLCAKSGHSANVGRQISRNIKGCGTFA